MTYHDYPTTSSTLDNGECGEVKSSLPKILGKP